MDLFTPCGQGQRLGLFAGSGVGKSTLMGMLAKGADADVIVIGLIGERGREVREFVEDALGPEGLARLDAIIRATPRTKVLAGAVAEGMITYVSRTRWMGFPDYTTVQRDGDVLKIYGRLRFGRSDLGVNKARVEGWLAALEAG